MLLCLSTNHKSAPFEVLERLAGAPRDTARKLLEQKPRPRGVVILATCNRFEVYLDLDLPVGASPLPAVDATLRQLSEIGGTTPEQLKDVTVLRHGNIVAEHLFTVASGLDSALVGEGEIAGQVRRALDAARQSHSTTPELERLFQSAARTSRAVKNRTGITGAGRSLVRLALDLASSRVSEWGPCRILLIGTGRYAAATVAALRDRGATDVRVYSPSGRAESFAGRHGVHAVPATGLVEAIAAAEVVLSCSTTQQYVIDTTMLTEPSTHRTLMIDLGLPRNIDPDVASVANVDLLDLETIRIHAPLDIFSETDAALDVISGATRDFAAVSDQLDLTPAVIALRAHVSGVLEAEIERAQARGDDDGRTEAALRHLVGVLLHTPMVRSRECASSGEHRAFTDGLQALFGISVPLEKPTSSTAHNEIVA